MDTDVARIVGASVTSQLTTSEKIIVNFLIVSGKVNVSEAQRLTGHTWHTAKRVLDKLTRQGILEYVHRPKVKVDRKAYYVLRIPKPE